MNQRSGGLGMARADTDNQAMELSDYFRTVFALLFVLGLIGVLYLLARQYAARRLGFSVGRGVAGGRLAVVEARALDARRRLVLIRRDGVEHLLLLGPDRDVVVESGIPARATFEGTLARSGNSESAT